MTSLSSTTEWVDYKMQQLRDYLCWWCVLAASRKKQLWENTHQQCMKDLWQQSSVLLRPAVPAYINYQCAGDKAWLRMKKRWCAVVSWKPYLQFDREFHLGFKRLFFSPLLSFRSDTPTALAVISMQLVAPLRLPTRFLTSENNTYILKKGQRSEQLCSQSVYF